MQKELKALTGVDILTDSGAYKDTYTILKDIAEVWEGMDSMDQAAALELMAGKNRANTLAAILNNVEDLRDAYESALDAEGSAMRENEAYLDSIQGRIDLFNNALQTLWMNLLDTNIIKGVVDAGTSLLKFADTFTGKLTIIRAALLVFKKFKTGATFAEMFKGAIDNAQKAYVSIKSMVTATGTLTKADIARALASKGVENSLTRRIIAEAKLKGVKTALTKEQIKATASVLTEKFATDQLTASQYLAAMSTMGLKTALQALGNVLLHNPIYLAAAAVAALALAIDHFTTTAQEAADAAKEAFNEIQSVVDSTKSAIQELESELSTLQDKIDELNAKETSFVNDKELDKLQKQKEELEHSLKIQKQLLELQRESSNKQAVASMKAYTKAASQGAEETQKAAKTWGTIAGVVGGALLTIGGLALLPFSGGGSSMLSAAGISTIATSVGVGAAAGGLMGNKAGEVIGSGISSNEGTYDSWYETYTKALETSRAEEQKALEKYQKDSSNIKKLDKWQEAQQKTADIETEMYEHLSQMQQYMNSIEAGDGKKVDAELQEQLDAWNNFLDKLSISQEASGAEVTALDRIFGENASEEIQTIKTQILDAIGAGEEFDFESAINGSQKLKSTLDYVGLSAEDVKDYFTQIGESAAIASINDEEINPIDTYSTITESVSKYNEILEQTAEIIGNNTEVTQEYKDAIIDLVGSEEEVNDCFDDNNKLVVKNAKKLKDLVSQNIKLKKAQHQLDYYSLVRQLNDTLNGTNQLDAATKNSIYSLLDQINTVELAVYQYQKLEDSLLGASNAFDEFAKAQEIDSLNTYGDSYTEMVQTMYDAMYKTGQVGTEAFETATEFLVPDHIYKGIKDESDRMKAIYDYFNKNILPSGNLDEDKFSLDYASVEYFVKKGLKSGVFTGNIEDFDLVEGMNLDEAAEKLGYTKTQTYALFAELDKYNTNSTELSFLSQLDDSLDGRITNIANNMEELNRQKLALLEDGGYDKHKAEIDAINKQLGQCEQNLEAASVDAYNMWQEYSNNDVALNALSEIEDKQQEITKEGAATLGLEWDEVKGKTIQQVYDEILAKQQELGVPTELTVQFAKEHIEAELDNLEKKLKEKKIDIDANVVWDEEDKQYEAAENSQYADDEDLQKYISLQNEGYALDGYLEDGMTATEEHLSAIQDILQNIYDYQTGKNTDESDGELNTNDSSNINNEDVSAQGINLDGIASFFTDTIPEVAGNISAEIGQFFTEIIPEEVEKFKKTLSDFFSETVPEKWNEFWEYIGNIFDDIYNAGAALGQKVQDFFAVTIPAKWDEFWNGVENFINSISSHAQVLGDKVDDFFTETIPEKWNEFWESVDLFFNDMAYNAGQLAHEVYDFFTITVPNAINTCFTSISNFITNTVPNALSAAGQSVATFFTVTVPNALQTLLNNISGYINNTVIPSLQAIGQSITTFFTVTVPAAFSTFLNNASNYINNNIIPSLQNVGQQIATFFTVTVPTSISTFINGIVGYINNTIIPGLQNIGTQITTFFTVTVPNAFQTFISNVGNFITNTIPTAIQNVGTIITTFFTVTVPNYISNMFSNIASSISSWVNNKINYFKQGWNDNSNNTYNPPSSRSTRVNGTAHARGTAYKGGSWGAPKTETALVGELGPEMLVRNGRWTTVGDNGAEFTQVKKGDIIFNHKQTEDLLSKGYATGRGKLHGGAFASGTAYSGIWKPVSATASQSNKPGNDFSVKGDELYKSSKSLTDAANAISNSSKDAADEFREVFDWIEIRLEEINEAISLKNAKLENSIGFSKQNAVIDEMIELNQKLYDNLISGANKYYDLSSKLLKKIPSEYREAAKDGSIAIETFVGNVDEKTLEAIQDYREWVQKGADATQQAEETLTEISTLAKQAIDNISQDYENKNSLRENKMDQLEAYNTLIETTEGFESEKIYQQLIKENNKIIGNLQTQRDKMQAELNEQVGAGNIKKYSQDWYDAVNEIAAVDTEIIELTTDTKNYQDTINELYWDKFDALVSRLESASDEADNLIDILSNKDLVDESGNWTDEGITSLGLYAQQMEIAEVQAKKYQEEIKSLNKNWKKLGYTEEEYFEKLNELKDGQYESIQAYHDAKNAIVDLNKERVDAIKEGIEKEIEAREKLIEKQKEELEAEKSLYDFQKSIMEQEKDVADLKRQLAALSSDNSASARAKRAQLEAELAEAEAALKDSYYDRSIQNQQDALDKELENFRDEKDAEMEGWDEYLENTEQVISDSLSVIQENTDVVYQTLSAMGKEYSLSITESLTSPWKEGEYAVQSFSEQFGVTMSATVDELKELELQFKEIMAEIEQSGKTAVSTVSDNASKYTEAAKKTTSSSGGSTSGSSSSTSSSNKSNSSSSSSTKKSSTAGLVSSISGNIKYGDKGSKVKKLQKALNALGYGNSGTSSVDGIFGDKTLSAVKKFQKAMGISADGIVGANTKKKFKLKGYAVGSTGIDEDQWALIDELGPELQLVPGRNGRLEYVKMGTGIIPADLTERLMNLAMDPQSMLDANRPSITPNKSIVNTEINLDCSVGTLVNIEHCDQNTLQDVEKIVDKAFNKHMQSINNSLKRYTR